MLRLELPTDPRWVDIASISLEAILVDHAYCEQKAASSCISLIIKFPEFDEMVDVLTPVVAEEWQHFESVMQQIRKRGFKFGFPERIIMLLNFSLCSQGREPQRPSVRVTTDECTYRSQIL